VTLAVIWPPLATLNPVETYWKPSSSNAWWTLSLRSSSSSNENGWLSTSLILREIKQQVRKLMEAK